MGLKSLFKKKKTQNQVFIWKIWMHQNPKYFDFKVVCVCLKEAEKQDCSCGLGSVVAFYPPSDSLAPLMLSLTMAHAAGMRTWEQAALSRHFPWSITAPL